MNGTIPAFVSGALFGAGLLIARMTDTTVVRGFLDVAGDWQPNLLFVMVGAIAVHLATYQWIRHRPSPLLRDVFHLPHLSRVDRPLILGAAVFGIGWGIAGVCPGPGLVSMTAGSGTLWFVVAMVGGMLLHDRTPIGGWFQRRLK